jgi:guanylate kinase
MLGKTKNCNIIIITAPSGCGKTTLINMLLEKHNDIEFSISTTTRDPRRNEKDGVNYYFTSIDNFKDMISEDMFVEWAKVHGHYYGTQYSEIKRILDKGHKCLLDVDVQGGLNLMKVFPGCKSIFIEPPSVEELEKRLRSRATETEEVIRQRMTDSLDELMFKDEYRYRIVNDRLEIAFEELDNIIYNE